MQKALFPPYSDHIYTVTELTRDIKSLLEEQFATLWVTGEISNFHAHSSGHFYFTLKDENTQITAVMFRSANRHLKFSLEDGLEVLANGRVTVYEPRGNYQILIEFIEPKGLGALQLAFDQLRHKLQEEGLFEETRKKPLPFFPHTVGLITSPTGAAVRDMIHVLHRRNPYLNILLFPVNVQGQEAAPEIAAAIAAMNRQAEAEVLIVGRGGGSLEDLWAFNTEIVARAIGSSRIPVVSAVGHETDVTISDFAADLRAPTPSAAAERVVPVAADLRTSLADRVSRLERNIRNSLEQKRSLLKFWTSHLKHPKRRLEEMSQHLDDLVTRTRLAIKRSLSERRTRLNHLYEKLHALSPLSILSRGYSIVRHWTPEGGAGPILKDAGTTKPGDLLSVRLMKGSLKAEVK